MTRVSRRSRGACEAYPFCAGTKPLASDLAPSTNVSRACKRQSLMGESRSVNLELTWAGCAWLLSRRASSGRSIAAVAIQVPAERPPTGRRGTSSRGPVVGHCLSVRGLSGGRKRTLIPRTQPLRLLRTTPGVPYISGGFHLFRHLVFPYKCAHNFVVHNNIYLGNNLHTADLQ